MSTVDRRRRSTTIALVQIRIDFLEPDADAGPIFEGDVEIEDPTARWVIDAPRSPARSGEPPDRVVVSQMDGPTVVARAEGSFRRDPDRLEHWFLQGNPFSPVE